MTRDRRPPPLPRPVDRSRSAIAGRWLRGLLRSFGFAFAGIAELLQQERNAQVHLAITLLVLLCGILLRISHADWLAIVLAIALVLALEALNTAIETLVDLVTPQPHPLARRAKDLAAGAVLLGALGAAAVAALVFVPRLLALLP